MTFVVEAMERDAEPDASIMSAETNVLMLLAAGGYLWRDAERWATGYDAPLDAAQSAVDWMTEHPHEDENERFEKLARAVFWTLETFSSLALPPESGAMHGEASLDVGFEGMAEFSCDTEGLDRGSMTIGQEGMRAAFTSGVALREVQRYFS